MYTMFCLNLFLIPTRPTQFSKFQETLCFSILLINVFERFSENEYFRHNSSASNYTEILRDKKITVLYK